MQFCTLDEAWGKKKNNENKDITIKKNDVPKNEETEKEDSSEYSPEISKKQIFKSYQKKPKKIYYNATEESLFDGLTDTINDKHERDRLVRKVLKSRRCRNVLRKKFRPNLVNKFILILDDYRDILVLILIGFSLVIFLSMLYNINKK